MVTKCLYAWHINFVRILRNSNRNSGHNHYSTLLWRHYECFGVSNHQPHDCLPNRLIRRILKKTPKLRVTGLCEGNSPVTGEFPAHRASNAKNVSIWWRHHDFVELHVEKFTWGTKHSEKHANNQHSLPCSNFIFNVSTLRYPLTDCVWPLLSMYSAIFLPRIIYPLVHIVTNTELPQRQWSNLEGYR